MKAMNPNKERLIEMIQQSGVHNSEVLTALKRVDRALFVPSDSISLAYLDEPIVTSHQQVTTQPSLVARMVDALSLKKEDRVLEIGTGLGYQAAVLSFLCREVYTMEQFADFVVEAKRNLKRAKISNVKVFLGDGSLGLPDHAPFDAIVLAAAAPEIPLPLQEQLVEGGRLVQPIGLGGGERVNVYWKKEGKLQFRKRVTLARFVKLTGTFGINPRINPEKQNRTNRTQFIHWMKCPKCGHPMEEINLSGIGADQCEYCRGIYFDRGEFETLLESIIPKSYLKVFFKKLWNGMSRFDTAWRP